MNNTVRLRRSPKLHAPPVHTTCQLNMHVIACMPQLQQPCQTMCCCLPRALGHKGTAFGMLYKQPSHNPCTEQPRSLQQNRDALKSNKLYTQPVHIPRLAHAYGSTYAPAIAKVGGPTHACDCLGTSRYHVPNLSSCTDRSVQIQTTPTKPQHQAKQGHDRQL